MQMLLHHDGAVTGLTVAPWLNIGTLVFGVGPGNLVSSA